ncbi:PO11 protein, partial [Pseudoatta argentina]
MVTTLVDTLSKTQVYQWYERYKSGREAVEDDTRPGRPSTSKTDENKLNFLNSTLSMEFIEDGVSLEENGMKTTESGVSGGVSEKIGGGAHRGRSTSLCTSGGDREPGLEGDMEWSGLDSFTGARSPIRTRGRTAATEGKLLRPRVKVIEEDLKSPYFRPPLQGISKQLNPLAIEADRITTIGRKPPPFKRKGRTDDLDDEKSRERLLPRLFKEMGVVPAMAPPIKAPPAKQGGQPKAKGAKTAPKAGGKAPGVPPSAVRRDPSPPAVPQTTGTEGCAADANEATWAQVVSRVAKKAAAKAEKTETAPPKSAKGAKTSVSPARDLRRPYQLLRGGGEDQILDLPPRYGDRRSPTQKGHHGGPHLRDPGPGEPRQSRQTGTLVSRPSRTAEVRDSGLDDSATPTELCCRLGASSVIGAWRPVTCSRGARARLTDPGRATGEGQKASGPPATTVAGQTPAAATTAEASSAVPDVEMAVPDVEMAEVTTAAAKGVADGPQINVARPRPDEPQPLGRGAKHVNAHGLVLLNRSRVSTLVGARGESIVDLTWATPAAVIKIRGWHVDASSFGEMSDRHEKERRWALRKLDPGALEVSLLSSTWPEPNPARSVEEKADWLGDAMSRACDASMPRCRPVAKKAAYWWSEELAELRRATVAARRQYTRRRRRGTDTEVEVAAEALREARSALRAAIRRAKADAWRELVSSLDRDPWGRPYKIVTKQFRPWAPPGKGYSRKGRSPVRTDGELSVTGEEMVKAFARLKGRQRTPGPSGIHGRVWLVAAPIVGGRLRRLFTSCLRDGIFPRSWKTARLVLLRKEGKPAESPSAYRLICLLDDAGKLLERVIAARIVLHLSRDGLNLSRGQYGFREGLSTIDAVRQVRALSEQLIAGGEVALAVTTSASRWGPPSHFDEIAPRLGRRADALLGLMPNLRGPNESVRRAYMHAVLSGALYGAPVWSGKALASRRIKQRLHSVQRRLALRICRVYRTVSYTAAMVLVGIPPAEYVADALAETFARMKIFRLVTPMTVDRLRGNARRQVFKEWRATLENDPPTTGARTVEAILPCLEQWIGRGWGGLSFHATQVLTGHGCFGEYLCRIGKELTASCHHCDGDRDNAQHTLEACPAWAGERGVLIQEIGKDLSLPVVVKEMVGRENAWRAFSFCDRVMSQKEEAERQRERAPGGRRPLPPPPPPGGGGGKGGGDARGGGVGGRRGRRLQPGRSRPGSPLARTRRRDRPTGRERRRPPSPIAERTEEEDVGVVRGSGGISEPSTFAATTISEGPASWTRGAVKRRRLADPRVEPPPEKG